MLSVTKSMDQRSSVRCGNSMITLVPAAPFLRRLLLSASPIRNENGDIIAVIETLQDVTEERVLQDNEKAMQQQLIHAEKMNAVGQLAASVAHEINNPLAGVLIYIKLLKKRRWR
ncbi:histidine kinase dimerization/phospho-acceptor domain-containing protein [Chloroflexota bacterium]